MLGEREKKGLGKKGGIVKHGKKINSGGGGKEEDRAARRRIWSLKGRGGWFAPIRNKRVPAGTVGASRQEVLGIETKPAKKRKKKTPHATSETGTGNLWNPGPVEGIEKSKPKKKKKRPDSKKRKKQKTGGPGGSGSIRSSTTQQRKGRQKTHGKREKLTKEEENRDAKGEKYMPRGRREGKAIS